MLEQRGSTTKVPGSRGGCRQFWISRDVRRKRHFPVDLLGFWGCVSTTFVALEVVVTDWGGSNETEVGGGGNRRFPETATNSDGNGFRVCLG